MSSRHRFSPSRQKNYDNSQSYRGRQLYHRSISQAQTSQDDHSDTRSCSSHRKYDRDYGRSYRHSTQRLSDERNVKTHYEGDHKGYNSFSDDSIRHDRLFYRQKNRFQRKQQGKNDSSAPTKKLQQGQNSVKKQKHSQRRSDQQHDKKSIQQQARILIDKVQNFDYQHKNFTELKKDFYEVCHGHIYFNQSFPSAINDIGKEILKNGVFHEMWGKVLKRNEQYQTEERFQEYYDKYRDKVQFGLTGFEKMFNPAPEEDYEDFKMTNTFKRYRNSMEESTRISAKMDCMLLFQQVKQEMKIDRLQQKIGKSLLNKVEERRIDLITAEEPLQTATKQLLDIYYNGQSPIRQNSQIDKGNRQEAIKKIQESRQREKSPFSSRFRMMHECQSNERRMCIETACMFFKVEQYYHINDVEIVMVEESIFSEKQEIVVIKAYTVDFSKQQGKYAIEPKLKNLIAAYKFSGVLELIRLEQTYGKFDGMVVYAERFDIKKYLNNQKEITPNKQEFAKQIKDKINSIQNQDY